MKKLKAILFDVDGVLLDSTAANAAFYRELFRRIGNVDLTDKGRDEAALAGRQMRDGGFSFDIAYTSVLKRAIRTCWIALDQMDLLWIPMSRDWRHKKYGSMTCFGINAVNDPYAPESRLPAPLLSNPVGLIVTTDAANA